MKQDGNARFATCRKVGAAPSCISTFRRGSMKASNIEIMSSDVVKMSRASVRWKVVRCRTFADADWPTNKNTRAGATAKG